MTRLLPLLLLVAATVLSGCGGDGAAEGEGRLGVVATTTVAADLVRQVGGDRVQVTALLPAGADPHDHEVRPGDVKALAAAGLVVRSGGDLDEWLEDAVAASGTEAATVTLLDAARPHRQGGEIDPHWWHDPRNAIRAVGALERALAEADVDGAGAYARRAAAYTGRLEDLDAAVAACLARVPPERRKLVTTHDALGYYADRYDLDVVGAVIPSLSTQAQPSAGDTAALVETIRREGVRAIFAESAVGAKVEEAIARETGAAVGRPLWADALGAPGSGGETYLRAVAANTRAIAAGLSGGEVRCRLPL